MAFSFADFETTMARLGDFASAKNIAVGVSGGPDSMALCWLLSQWAKKNDAQVFAYTVDHGLRIESAEEAKNVGAWIKDWPSVTHEILKWKGEKPETRILEEARKARYDLMIEAMRGAGAQALFLGHHQDDQAETFLIRLSKGSGLDGLAGMKEVQYLQDHIHLVRPLLSVSKDDLITICNDNKIPFVKDPTNENEDYTRSRLRAAKAVLEEEGLTSKRLATTAKRLARAREVLDDLAHDLFTLSLKEQKDDGFLFDYRSLHAAHEELVLRVLLNVMDQLRPDADYGPRMERLENLLERILKEPNFKGATLGGCQFALDRKNETLWVGKE